MEILSVQEETNLESFVIFFIFFHIFYYNSIDLVPRSEMNFFFLETTILYYES